MHTLVSTIAPDLNHAFLRGKRNTLINVIHPRFRQTLESLVARMAGVKANFQSWDNALFWRLTLAACWLFFISGKWITILSLNNSVLLFATPF